MTSRRFVVCMAAVLAVGWGVYWSMTVQGPTPLAARPAPQPAGPGAPDANDGETPGRAGQRPSASREVAAGAGPEVVSVRGVVRVEGGLEIGERGMIDGRMRLRPRGEGPHGQPVEVVVRDGSWAADLKRHLRYLAEDVRIRGIRAQGVDGRIDVTPESPGVCVELGTRGRLRVVDAETGQHVRGVRCVQPVFRAELGFSVPPPGRPRGVFSRPADSPLPLPDSEETAAYWIGAAGYEWTRLVVGSAEADVTCELSRAGAVVVRVPSSAARLPHLAVLLQQEGGTVAQESRWVAIRELSGTGLELEFDPVPAGKYTVALGNRLNRVDPRQGMRRPRVSDFDWAVVTAAQVSAGERAEVEFPSPLPWGPGDTGLRLLITEIDASRWDTSRDAQKLLVRRLDSDSPGVLQETAVEPYGSTSFRDLGDRLQWNVGGMRAGSYRITLQPCGLSERFEVRAGETATVSLSLDELAFVTVHVRSTEDSVALPPLVLDWRRSGAPVGVGWSGAAEETDADGSTVFRFSCVPGSVDCMLLGSGHVAKSREFALHAGPQEVLMEFEPEPLSFVEIELRADGRPIVAPLEWFGAIAATDFLGRPVDCSYRGSVSAGASTYGMAWDTSAARLGVSAREGCTLHFSSLNGRPVPDSIRVELREEDPLRYPVTVEPRTSPR